ncbi:MAG: hypothetical protein AVDCRST_MAG38-2889, partial [uncultured Solirubrobacteraceae bacterium]
GWCGARRLAGAPGSAELAGGARGDGEGDERSGGEHQSV